MASSKRYSPTRSELDAQTEKELAVNLAQLAETGHFTKVFDPSRTISPEHFDLLMKVLFLAGSLGSLAGSRVWQAFGWSGVCARGVAGPRCNAALGHSLGSWN